MSECEALRVVARRMFNLANRDRGAPPPSDAELIIGARGGPSGFMARNTGARTPFSTRWRMPSREAVVIRIPMIG